TGFAITSRTGITQTPTGPFEDVVIAVVETLCSAPRTEATLKPAAIARAPSQITSLRIKNRVIR
ncbi:MAG: hypothetical protein RIQ79_1820, partial [Verrucomicrobiota bacterium]